MASPSPFLRSTHLTVRIKSTVVKVVHLVSCPSWERNRLSRATKDSKSRNEYHDLGTTIKSSRDQVVPLHEPLRAVSSEVELTKGTKDEVAGD